MNWEKLVRQLDDGTLDENAAGMLRNLALENETAPTRMAAEPASEEDQQPTTIVRRIPGVYKALSILLLFVAVVLSVWVVRAGRNPELATVAAVAGMKDNGPFLVGEKLKPGPCELAAGERVELVFHNGTRFEARGPARFGIVDANLVRLELGLLKVRLDPRGGKFVVESPEARVLDLGTAFTVARAREGATEVHVDQGGVRLERGDQKKIVHAGEAAVADAAGGISGVDYLKNRFEGDLDNRSKDQDGDGIPDDLEKLLGSNAEHADSAPSPLLASWSLEGQEIGQELDGPAGDLILHGGIVTEGLSYSSGSHQLLTQPKAVLTGSSRKDFECWLDIKRDAIPEAGTIYLSFLMRIQQPDARSESGYAGLSFNDERGNETFFVGDGWKPSGWVVFSPTEGPEDDLGIALDSATHLVVVALDYSRQVTDVWVDPELGLAVRPGKPTFRSQFVPEFALLSLRSGVSHHTGGYPCVFDELKIGVTWQSVVQVVAEKNGGK